MTGSRQEVQVKQYVGVAEGAHGRFMVFETGSAQHFLFAQLYPGTLTQTGLSWPVRKTDLRAEVRRALRHGGSYRKEPAHVP